MYTIAVLRNSMWPLLERSLEIKASITPKKLSLDFLIDAARSNEATCFDRAVFAALTSLGLTFKWMILFWAASSALIFASRSLSSAFSLCSFNSAFKCFEKLICLCNGMWYFGRGVRSLQGAAAKGSFDILLANVVKLHTQRIFFSPSHFQKA